MLTMIRAVIRTEKTDKVLTALMEAGFQAVTRYSVAGRAVPDCLSPEENA